MQTVEYRDFQNEGLASISCYPSSMIEQAELACWLLVENYGGDTLLCDAAAEQADACIPTMDADVFSVANYLDECVADALNGGLVSIDRDTFSLVQLARAGYYLFLDSAIYNARETIIYNIITNYINNAGGVADDADLDEVDAEISRRAENADFNISYSAYEREADEIRTMFDGK